MNKRQGFTLIELLVVISIIALLLAILMPALGQVKKKAQAVVCKSNIKQWGVIFSLYANDNDSSVPQGPGGGGLSGTDAYWKGATYPYYKSPEIRECPSCKPGNLDDGNGVYGRTYQNWGPTTTASWDDEWPEGSYGLNEWCSNPPSGVTNYWGENGGCDATKSFRKMFAKGASNVPLFMDCVFVSVAPDDDGRLSLPLDQPDTANEWRAMETVCMDRHSGGINIVFLDASARHVTIKELWTLKWHKTFDTNNSWTLSDAPWPDWIKK
ncbi:MAG: type II secretion system protein [Anaerohalosphaera sp.]|nr:type II secretion system protein [Anaerohalosphaera sp.]